MAIERKFTITCAKWLMLLLIAGGTSVSIASESSSLRSVTLQEPKSTTVHTYSEDTQSAKAETFKNKRTTQHHSYGVWLFDVTISLNQDFDNDGYHSNFSITFDFDTYGSSTLVYAVLYVSQDNGPWIEYAVTGNFSVGDAHDAYTIQATLDSGYQTGYYDHYIEVYDAYTHDYLAGFGPEDSHVLHGVPIESTPHDRHRGSLHQSHLISAAPVHSTPVHSDYWRFSCTSRSDANAV